MSCFNVAETREVFSSPVGLVTPHHRLPYSLAGHGSDHFREKVDLACGQKTPAINGAIPSKMSPESAAAATPGFSVHHLLELEGYRRNQYALASGGQGLMSMTSSYVEGGGGGSGGGRGASQKAELESGVAGLLKTRRASGSECNSRGVYVDGGSTTIPTKLQIKSLTGEHRKTGKGKDIHAE